MRFLIWFIIFSFSSIGLFSQTVLRADGPGDTYELITRVLAPGFWPLETPDCSHEAFGRHIDEVYDPILNEYVFRFYIHVRPDNDRCLYADRQRNEVKVYSGSPDSLKGFGDDRMIYAWVFKLDSVFQPSYSFTHIHQLKAVGGEEERMPLITLTLRKATPDVLQLCYARHDEQMILATVPLSKIAGKWVRVREEVWYGESGSYEITLEDALEGMEILHYRKDTIRMWRTEASFIRPKWGIYRSLDHAEQLRDEEVLFNNFRIEKIISPLSGDPVFFDKIMVYPDPVSDILHFDIEGSSGIRFTRLFDVWGQILRENYDWDSRHIDVSSLPAGIYFLEFRKGDEVIMKKFIRK